MPVPALLFNKYRGRAVALEVRHILLLRVGDFAAAQ